MNKKINNIDLIHIGFHKTASTLLQETIFLENKTINLVNSSTEENDLWFYRNFVNINPHEFSCEKFINKFKKKFQLEQKVNQKRKIFNIVSDENLSGDPSTGIDSYEVMKRIFDCFENPKILIVIRNQVGMLISLYSNYINNGGTKNFSSWINGAETRWGMILNKLNYLPIIKNYQNLFSEKNVKTICYEDLWSPENGLKSYFKKFHINLELTNTKKSLNKGRSLFFNKIFTFINFTENKLLNRIASKFLRGNYSMNDREFVKKNIPNFFNEIIKYNRELEILLKINLPKKYFE